MEIGGLFDDELEFLTTEVNGLRLKHMQQDAGQLARGMPLTVWPAASVLADFLIRDLPPHSTVIELGAGTGLVGLSVDKQRADVRVSVTDGDQSSLELIQENAVANASRAEVFKLDWGSVPDELRQSFDFVVGSDVVYAAEAVYPLLLSIRQLMKPTGAGYLANFKHRYNLHEHKITETAGTLGLSLEELKSSSDIRLLRLTINGSAD